MSSLFVEKEFYAWIVGKPYCTGLCLKDEAMARNLLFSCLGIGVITLRLVQYFDSYDGKSNVIRVVFDGKDLLLAYDGDKFCWAENKQMDILWCEELGDSNYFEYYKRLCCEFAKLYPEIKLLFSKDDLPGLDYDFELNAVEYYGPSIGTIDFGGDIVSKRGPFLGSNFSYASEVKAGISIVDFRNENSVAVKYFYFSENDCIVVGRVEKDKSDCALLFKIVGGEYFISYLDNLNISRSEMLNSFDERCGEISNLGTSVYFDSWVAGALREFEKSFLDANDATNGIVPCVAPVGPAHGSLVKERS